LQDNAYYAHPENLLMAMTCDSTPTIRALAWKRIKKARSSKKGVRGDFNLPAINMGAAVYYDMIDWVTCDVTEPRLTRRLEDREIEKRISTFAYGTNSTGHYPCHTQGVERLVKLVTEASSSVFGAKARDLYVKAKLQSRQQMPSLGTKKGYNTASQS